MKNTYGYTPLSYELIDLFRSGAPDFEKAADLIKRGADVNDQGNDKEENVLSEILCGYWQSTTGDSTQEACEDCEDDYKDCSGCDKGLNPQWGESMIQVIKFFLDHGFDVTKQNGAYGGQCLVALALSSFDKNILDAIKLIMHAYGNNLPPWDDSEDSPLDAVESECSYQRAESDYYLSNILEAACQIFYAINAGHPYDGIQSFEDAIGRKVLRILARTDKKDDIFHTLDRLESYHQNCFECNLYFILENGHLVYSRYVDCWVDTYLPDVPMTDVSGLFPSILNHTIEDITMGGNSIRKMRSTNSLPFTTYGQPIISLHFDNDVILNFTRNFGEVPRDDTVTYYYYGDKENIQRTQDFNDTYTLLNNNHCFDLLHKLELHRFGIREDVTTSVIPYVMRAGHFNTGYCGYYIWAGLDNLELNYHIINQNDNYTICGFTSHFSSKMVWDAEVIEEVSWNPTRDPLARTVKFTNPDSHKGQASIQLVNSDVLPDYSPGTIYKLQVTGIANSVDYYESIAAYETDTNNSQSPSADMNSIISLSPGENIVIGQIKKVASKSIYLGSTLKSVKRLSIEIDTNLGPFEIVHHQDLVKNEQQNNIKEGAVLKANCIILGDVAIYKYARGAICDEEHYIQLLRYCIERNNYIRITPKLSPNCKYNHNNHEVNEYNGKNIAAFINNILPSSNDLENMSITIGETNNKPHVIVSDITDKESSKYIFIDLNDNDEINELRVLEHNP